MFRKLIGLLDARSVRIGLLSAVVGALAWLVLGELQKLLAEVSYAELVRALAATPDRRLLLAVGATAASYLSLIGYDFSALRYAHAKVRGWTVALTSFIAFALGNTVGLGALTGGAVRMRLYSAAGLEPMQVTRVVAFNALAFGVGTTALGAAGLLWGAPEVAALAHLPAWLLRAFALALLAGVAVFIALCARRTHLQIYRWQLELPGWPLAARQLLISAADLGFAALTLWLLLPHGCVALPAFFAFYVIALALGVISHVPGGLGVFEAVILLAVGGRLPLEQIAGALLLYRIIYFLLPLALAAVLLVGYELRLGMAAPIVDAAAPIARAAARLTPTLLAALTFITGLVLLVSGVTPTASDAAELLALRVPLVLVESAHLIGSICGLLLLVLARGLLHRLDAAWWGAVLATGVSFWLALPKGIALHEMMLLGLVFVLLVVSRREFDRRSSLFGQTFDAFWFVCVAAALAAVVWILFFAYRNVEYSQQLWWRFEFDQSAPRSLRALMAVALTALTLAAWQLLRKPAGEPAAPSEADIQRAAAVVRSQPAAGAGLALAGDKSFLFSPSGRSFIMYGKQGRSWIALFDPVGPEDEWPELVWSFIELAHAHGGRAAFYQVCPRAISLYLDAGLRAFKLGEYAWVPLADFNLKGGRRANLRTSVNRASREGLVFEVLPAPQSYALLREASVVSESWLVEQDTREKGFSLGAFEETYVRRMPVATVRLGGELVAFATLLETGAAQEASVDLMRQAAKAPPGTMDFLFVRLIEHYQARGVERFGLGMAPLSGMAAHELAPRWHRIGRLLFGHGERFYHFRGLRSFKEKFDPDWEPRYLAAPGGLAPLLVLADTAALIGRGLSGVVTR